MENTGPLFEPSQLLEKLDAINIAAEKAKSNSIKTDAGSCSNEPVDPETGVKCPVKKYVRQILRLAEDLKKELQNSNNLIEKIVTNEVNAIISVSDNVIFSYDQITFDQTKYQPIAIRMEGLQNNIKSAKEALAPSNLKKIGIGIGIIAGVLLAMMCYAKYFR